MRQLVMLGEPQRLERQEAGVDLGAAAAGRP